MNARGMNEPKKYPKKPDDIWKTKQESQMTAQQFERFFNSYNSRQQSAV